MTAYLHYDTITTPHTLFELMAGDDWEIFYTLLSGIGVPYDLTGTPDIKWLLLDTMNASALDNIDLVIVNAIEGVIAIKVAAADTAALGAGLYHDVVRLTLDGGITKTLIQGHIFVYGDPWAGVGALAMAARSQMLEPPLPNEDHDPFRKWP
jgi:hypothetical protein